MIRYARGPLPGRGLLALRDDCLGVRQEVFVEHLVDLVHDNASFAATGFGGTGLGVRIRVANPLVDLGFLIGLDAGGMCARHPTALQLDEPSNCLARRHSVRRVDLSALELTSTTARGIRLASKPVKSLTFKRIGQTRKKKKTAGKRTPKLDRAEQTDLF